MKFISINNFLQLGICLAVIFMAGCKEDDEPANPYDGIDHSGYTVIPSEPDPASITGLHKNIFSVKCANPGCHDGTFEPDFRTVQSSYSTLVYMPVNKFTVDSTNFFTMRVIPFDRNKSFLHERITTPTSDYMPSNGVRLSATEINYINTWIDNGAKDINGNVAVKPNLAPNIVGYIAANSSFVRIDTIRLNGIAYNPFIATPNTEIYLPFVAMDTADGASATDPSLFTVHEVKFSHFKDDFTSATTVNATWMSPIPFPAWQVTFNTGIWNTGDLIYFRIYVNDGFQPVPSEFPRNSTVDFYKTYYSFLIQ